MGRGGSAGSTVSRQGVAGMALSSKPGPDLPTQARRKRKRTATNPEILEGGYRRIFSSWYRPSPG